MHTSRKNHSVRQRQHGAAFIIMLVILIMGVTAFLVSSLSKVSLQSARIEKSSDMLAQAKEVVTGYAVTGISGQQPGNVLRPDVLSTSESPRNYDGQSEGGCLNANDPTGTAVPSMPVISGGANTALMRCLGRLPWKEYKLSVASPTDNDPTGFMPWYAVSANLVDPVCVTSTYNTGFNPECAAINPSRLALNSELLNSATPPHPWLTVRDMNGNVLSNRVAFVIIVPGPPVQGQSRPAYPNLGGANQYLDSISLPAGCGPTPPSPACTVTYSNADLDDDFIMGDEHRWIDDPANPGHQIEDPNYHFNDKLLYVTIDDLMPLIEKRIAREVKQCLDDYASAAGNPNHRYPWAASATDSTAYPDRNGAYNVRFGRITEVPNISTTSGGTPPTGALLTYIQAVQTALNNYLANPTSGNLSILNSKGDTLKDNASTGSPAYNAGLTADNCTGMSCTTTLQSQIDTAMGNANPDTMPVSWPASCTLFSTSTYWPDWRDLVFYQVAEGYRPGGGTFAPLQIVGSGNPNGGSGTTYRAAVIIAGKSLGAQTRPSYTSPPDNYLANAATENSADPAFVANSHNNAGSSTSFITYKTSDPYYQSVNDLVLCVDGKNNCQ